MFCVFIDGEVRVCVGPWRGIFKQKEQFDPIFFHLSILMVWRLPYPEIPTLMAIINYLNHMWTLTGEIQEINR